MRIKLAAIALAVSLLSAPFAITPTFAAPLTQAEVKTACAIGPAECKTAVAKFVAENKTNAPAIIALVRALSTDTNIKGANIAAGIAVVVAETKQGGLLYPTDGKPLFNPTQVAALVNIESAVTKNGAAIQTAALPKDFSTS